MPVTLLLLAVAAALDASGAPHHGGKSANPSWLYSWARPKAVIVSQPPPGTSDSLAPIERSGVLVLRTWRRGAILFQWAIEAIITSVLLDKSRQGQDFRPGEYRQEASKKNSFWRVSFNVLPSLPLVPVFLLRKIKARLLISFLSFLTGLLACILLAIVEFGAWALIVPGRGRVGNTKNDENPASAEEGQLVARPIRAVASDGTKLAGIWHPAEGPDGGRTVLLLHGFAEPPGALQAQRVLALVRNHWNVAALDLRGYGRSGGLFASFGGREASDVRAWIDRLENQPGLSGPLLPVLWGRSMGAAIAVRAGAEDPRIKALVLESPMVDLNEAMAVWFRNRHLPLPRLLARLVTYRAGQLAGVSLSRPAPIDLAPRVRCPVLIAHGGDDRLVPTESVRRLAGAFAVPPEMAEVPRAGHADVISLGGEAILDQIVRFLQDAITARANNIKV